MCSSRGGIRRGILVLTSVRTGRIFLRSSGDLAPSAVVHAVHLEATPHVRRQATLATGGAAF
jgi:hypothetical protein